MISVPNGSWTLAFYDGAAGETAILNSWCISFDYGCNFHGYSTTKASWSPSAGLFLDAASTIPYIPGTLADTVYAHPLPAGTYTYSVINQSLPLPGCTSPPGYVTVIVGTPAITVTTQPADQTICAGSDAHFTVVTNPSTGVSYQWMESSDGGATFHNIINGAPYSGVNSASLTITAPPLSMSGYFYRLVAAVNAPCGIVGTATARLLINTNPVVSFYAHPYHKLLPGLTTTLTSVVTPAAPYNYTWFYNGAPNGATSNEIVVDFAHIGLYQLQATNFYTGCSGLSDTMSIRDSATGLVGIYPNPSGGLFQTWVRAGSNAPEARTMIIYNSMGNRVITQPYTQTAAWQRVQLDLRRNGKGIYWLEIVNKDGKRISLSQVLIE